MGSHLNKHLGFNLFIATNMHLDFSRNNKLSCFVVSCRCYLHSPACASIEFSRLRLEYKEIKLGLSVRRTLEY